MSDANEIRPLGTVVKVRRGASPRPIGDPKYFGGEVGWVRISDVTQRNYKYLKQTEQYLSPLGESHSVRVNEGDLIMSICATVGKPIIVDMDACIHDGFVQLYDNQNVDTEYLFYILQFHEKDFEKRGQPGTQVNLNTTIVENEKVFIPEDLKEQQKIAKILTTVDNLIEKTEALIEKYQAIKQGMMHDLFTRGIDTNGQLRPSHLDAPHLYKQTELGWIPNEWTICSLSEYGAWQGGLTPSKSISGYWNQGKHLWISPKDVRSEELNDSEDKITDLALTNTTLKLFPAGALLVVFRSGILRNKIPVSFVDKAFTVNQDIKVLIPNDHFNAKFCFYLLKSREQEILRSYVKAGTTVESIDGESFFKMLCPKPSLCEQKYISKIMYTLEKSLNYEMESVKKYHQHKKGLMQDLLTGKVRVQPLDLGTGRVE